MRIINAAILVLCVSITQGIAQPALRVSATEFLDALSSHPDLQEHAGEAEVAQAEIEMAGIRPDPELQAGNVSGDISGINMPHQLFLGVGFTVETGNKRKHRMRYAHAAAQLAEAEHQAFITNFKREALELFQRCWMLEQQIGELDRHANDILALKIADGTMLLKQQLLAQETRMQLKTLQFQYDASVATLNDLGRHAWGDQPILPDGSVWSNEADIAGIPLQFGDVRLMQANV